MKELLNVDNITTGYEDNKILTDISFSVNKTLPVVVTTFLGTGGMV